MLWKSSRRLLDNHHDLKVVETPIYGYVAEHGNTSA